MKQTYILFIFLLTVTFSLQLQAQTRQQVFHRSIDQINCEISRLLLRSFDRPVAARNIQNCQFAAILQEVQRVKENKITGYKDDIIHIITSINNFKGKVGPEEDAQYINEVLQDVKDFSLDNFQQICTNYKRSDNRICQDLQQKHFKLENQINALINQSSTQIAQAAPSSASIPPTNVAQTAPAPVEEEESTGWFGRRKSNDETANTYAPSVEEDSSSSGKTSWFTTIILSLLTIAVGWLFKENYDLKEEVSDLKNLLKTFTQRR